MEEFFVQLIYGVIGGGILALLFFLAHLHDRVTKLERKVTNLRRARYGLKPRPEPMHGNHGQVDWLGDMDEGSPRFPGRRTAVSDQHSGDKQTEEK